MNKDVNQKLVALLNDHIEPLSKEEEETFSSLLEYIADAHFVLIGEASHGTKEFYQTRIAITRQLIKKKGFMAVAIEGDWPDAYSIHQYIQGRGKSKTPAEALNIFQRFPTWMWRNETMTLFIEWLKQYNDDRVSDVEKTGFYGLDLYSLNASMQSVIQYLMKVDPKAGERAKERYACFNHIGLDPQAYGYLTTTGIKKPCIDEAVEQLIELQHRAFKSIERDNLQDEEKLFFATQNARIVKDAEAYYRSMFERQTSSWNLRDQHMANTVNNLADHLQKRFQKPAKIVIWAHNSHVGDARATEMGEKGEVNIGQLLREQHERNVYSIGFSTYKGVVTAADNWDEPAQHKKINPGMQGSYEALFHALKYDDFLLNISDAEQLEAFLKIHRLQRAIGVIYRPETERMSHYFFSRLLYQFDCLIHFDQTSALQEI